MNLAPLKSTFLQCSYFWASRISMSSLVILLSLTRGSGVCPCQLSVAFVRLTMVHNGGLNNLQEYSHWQITRV